MPLVNAKCTNCGGILEIDNTQKAAICPYCNSAFIVEEAIQNYYITNEFHIDKVEVSGKNNAEKERLLKNAETQKRLLKKNEKAFEIYRTITEDYPDEPRGWLGLAGVLCNDFNDVDINYDKYNSVSLYVSNALAVASDEQKETIEKQLSTYQSKRSSFREQKQSELKELYIKKKNTEKQIEISKRNKSELNEKRHSVQNKINRSTTNGVGCFLAICFIIAAVFSIISNNLEIARLCIYVLAFYTIFRIIAAFNLARLKKKYTLLDNQFNAENANECRLYETIRSITDNIRQMEEKYNIRNL